jgi:hypothetical protein
VPEEIERFWPRNLDAANRNAPGDAGLPEEDDTSYRPEADEIACSITLVRKGLPESDEVNR